MEAELIAHDGNGSEILRSRVLLTLKKAAGGDDIEIASIERWDDNLQCYSRRFGISMEDYDTIEITRQQKTPAFSA